MIQPTTYPPIGRHSAEWKLFVTKQILGSRIFFDPIISGLKAFWTQNFSLTQNFSGHKIFFDRKFLLKTKFLFDPKFFGPYILLFLSILAYFVSFNLNITTKSKHY